MLPEMRIESEYSRVHAFHVVMGCIKGLPFRLLIPDSRLEM